MSLCSTVVAVCGRWAAAAIVLSAAACAGGDPTPPQVRIVDLQFLESSVFEQRFQIDLRIGNPNDFDLPLDGLTFDLEVNGQDFARGFTNERVTIPRLGEETISVVASTTLIELVQQMRLLAERGDLSYRLHGTAYLDSFARRQAPYEYEGSFSLRDRRTRPGKAI
ncbi:MAG: LEA type 2 family protein [Kiloniellaceae bacterium]